MSDSKFLQDPFDKRLAHLTEECGEVLAAIGKTQRWGLGSANPLLEPSERETNKAWLKRELQDLKQAIERVEETIDEQPCPTPTYKYNAGDRYG